MAGRGPAIKRDCTHPIARHEHGTDDAYRHDGCRCDDCRQAHNAKMYRYRRRCAQLHWSGSSMWMPSPVGFQRRVQALLALGWTTVALAERLGMATSSLDKLHTRPGDRMLRSTAEPLYELYEQISMVVPQGWVAERARRHAARKGWLPPLAWDDDEIDDPNATPADGARCKIEGCGEKHQAHGLCDKHYRRWVRTGSTDGPTSQGGRYKKDVAAEVHADVRRMLRSSGLTHVQIAERVGTTRRTVARISAQMRDEAQAA